MSHPPQHQSSVAISHASPADFTSLAAILPQANATNPVQYLMFRRATRSDLMHPSQRWAMIQFQNGQRPHSTAEGPTTFVLKAVPEESGQAVGFAIIRVYGGRQVIENGGMKKRVERITARCLDMDGGVQEETQSTDDVLNHDFCEEWNRRQKRIYERCMGGKDHAYLSTLMVLPAWQGHGIGSAIIRWALEHLHLDQMPFWLNAQPDGYKFYKRLGWRDIDNVDIDLSKWAGPNKGYGLHRTVCMLRDPSG